MQTGQTEGLNNHHRVVEHITTSTFLQILSDGPVIILSTHPGMFFCGGAPPT